MKEKQNDWIRIEKRKPPYNMTVQITVQTLGSLGTSSDAGYYTGIEWKDAKGKKIDDLTEKVIAWKFVDEPLKLY